MNIVQHTKLKVEKDGKEVVLDVAPDMPLGLLFDALMELKGYIVERMVSSHKEEEKASEEQKQKEEDQNGSES